MKVMQRGGVAREPKFGSRTVLYYEGGRFPYRDRQFDYVICSHVIEHVDDPESFLSEIFRVGGGRGYLEYPMITYEYLYDFDVHLHFIKFDFEECVLRYLPKRETVVSALPPVSDLLRMTLEYGWSDLCTANEELFFEGFEFETPFRAVKTDEFERLLPSRSIVKRKSFLRRAISYLENKVDL